MNAALALIAAAGLAGPALSQATPAAAEECLHVRTSFEFVVPASYAVAAPLFGPGGERAWAGKHWDPKFIYPLPAADVEGAVFTIPHEPHEAIWINTLFDIDGGHFQYVYFLPNLMVTLIDVGLKPVNADSTAVKVVYARTAITPEGNGHVKALSDGDKTAGRDWQKAIEDYLARSKTASRP